MLPSTASGWKTTLTGLQYDMMTTPITTDYFHDRVRRLVWETMDARKKNPATGHEPQAPTIPPLTDLDTNLAPTEYTSQLLAFSSPWIDLCSPDPLIYSISKQVLSMELAYAAFCGIDFVFVAAPKLYHGDVMTQGTTEYAMAIQAGLTVSTHMNISLVFPMIADPTLDETDEEKHFASLTRDEFLDYAEEMRPSKVDNFGTWDAWNLIRTICKYNSRLFVGKNQDAVFASLLSR